MYAKSSAMIITSNKIITLYIIEKTGACAASLYNIMVTRNPYRLSQNSPNPIRIRRSHFNFVYLTLPCVILWYNNSTAHYYYYCCIRVACSWCLSQFVSVESQLFVSYRRHRRHEMIKTSKTNLPGLYEVLIWRKKN